MLSLYPTNLVRAPPPAFVRHPSSSAASAPTPRPPPAPAPPAVASSSSSSTTRPPPSSSAPLTPTPSAPPAPAPAPAPALPPPASPTQINIAAYPSADLLRLLASLLSQIAQANDALRAPAAPPPLPSPAALAARPAWGSLTDAARASHGGAGAPLAFHARTVPTISLHAYLARIHKYCPAPNDVFLALLVYFDRMARLSADATGRGFVIDSFNVHRLVIAGVTVASKFFSDVFYTNSRYAKVGGLPQTELNALELQFLLLNDFRLRVSDAEMQHYADQLILFSRTPPSPAPSPASPVPRPRLVHHASAASLASEEGTDAGGSTDDEPTVRPAASCAGGTDDEGSDGEDEGANAGSDGTEGAGSDEDERASPKGRPRAGTAGAR